MHKIEVRLTQVYRINGRLVVANSIEGAINTWREWYNTTHVPDIRSIERMANDSYQVPTGDEALVCAEGLCGDFTDSCVEQIARLSEERDKLKYELEKANTFIANLRPDSEQKGLAWIPNPDFIKSVYAASGVMEQMNEHTDAKNLMALWEELKQYHQAATTGVGK